MSAEQITALAALAGKTIAQTSTTDRHEPAAVALVFTDGSYLRFRGCNYGLEWRSRPSDDEAVALGLMTGLERDRRLAERREREAAEAEVRERREYERLRAKFEGEPKS